MSDPADYTIGWISAFHLEYVAAQVFLESRHEKLKRIHPNDQNHYVLGAIKGHKVAMAVLPGGQHGMVSAMVAATQMWQTFSNLRFCLMVGIGGGVPSGQHDIRLGDVVVSYPTWRKVQGNQGGVIQYDYGNTIREKHFQSARFLNKPPRALLSAVEGLRTEYQIRGNQIDASICAVLEKYPRLQGKYRRPHPDTDRLYSYDASVGTSNCTDGPAALSSSLINRPQRTEEDDDPAVHYGLIASADNFMKDARIRDTLSREMDVLCFEMEAAGLINDFPCLVIRGICDYADKHYSSSDWRGYAAMAASAYARDLLHEVVAAQVEAEKKMSDILSGMHGIAQEQLQVTREQLQIQKSLVQETLTKMEQECHQLFRLTASGSDVTYEWYKNRIENRTEGTCQWVLKHEHFQSWLKQESGPLLVTGDPGCGKSVLAKYLVDDGLPRTTICYFFFKDRDQNTAQQALCAVLHQLFSQKPALIRHAMTQFAKDGPGLINIIESLWRVLQSATMDPQAGPVIVVLDALDECCELGFINLVKNIEGQFRGQAGSSRLKYLLTCRPYEQITSRFHNLSSMFLKIRIPGEEESEMISQEVDRVIIQRVNQLSDIKRLSHDVKMHLQKRLQQVTHRTYLWVYLVFEYLDREGFKKTIKGVNDAMRTLPGTVYEAYEHILNRSKEHVMLRKMLCIVLEATRPLTLLEMSIATSMDNKKGTFDDLDLKEDEGDFKARLRFWSGLFISIYHDKVYLVHQSAREFLLGDLASATAIPSRLGQRWHQSITTRDAHGILAQLCVAYLDLFNTDTSLTNDSFSTGANRAVGHFMNRYALLDYAAESWCCHFNNAQMTDRADVVRLARRICNANSAAFSVWFTTYWATRSIVPIGDVFDDVIVASICGCRAVVKLLLEEENADIETKDAEHGRTPLAWAASQGHGDVVRLLLDKGADMETKDSEHGGTPLWLAAGEGREAMVRLLIDQGADVHAEARCGETALLRAQFYGNEAVVQLLLNHGAVVDAKRRHGETSLSLAAQMGDKAAVQLLLHHGANVNQENTLGQTPLLLAAERRDEAVVQLLLRWGADISARDTKYRQTSLCRAAVSGHMATAQLLLNWGADVDAEDRNGDTALVLAAREGYAAIVEKLLEKKATIGAKALACAADGGHTDVVQCLIDKGADTEAVSDGNNTPLCLAARRGHKATDVVRLLLERGALTETKCSSNGRTPLSLAAEGHDDTPIVQLLLENGADVECEDDYGWAPLTWAASAGNTMNIEKLLAASGDPKQKDYIGRTPLLLAAEQGQVANVQLLLAKHGHGVAGSLEQDHVPTSLCHIIQVELEAVIQRLRTSPTVDLNRKDPRGNTPLLWAVQNRHEVAVKLMLDKGAAVEMKSDHGETPLLCSAERGHAAIVELLLNNGAHMEARGRHNATPLLLAAARGHEATVKLLLDRGANIKAKCYFSRTPLYLAAEGGHEATVRLLLDKGINIDAKDHIGPPPLFIAAKRGHEVVVRLLLDKGANIEAEGYPEVTPLFTAIENGHEAIVGLLLDKSACTEQNRGSPTALWYAAMNGHQTLVRLLLDKGANIEAEYKDFTCHQTLLIWAAKKGNQTLVRLLLENGADVKAKDTSQNWTALSWAAKNGHEEVVRLLLKNGVGLEEKDYKIPLLLAAKYGHGAIVGLLRQWVNQRDADSQINAVWHHNPTFSSPRFANFARLFEDNK